MICGALDDVLPVVALRVEHPQRVVLDPIAEVVAERAGVIEQVLPEQRDVGRTALVVAHRVEQQRDPLQPQRFVEPVRQRDDLDVDIGVVDAEHLGPHLPVLPVATLLRALVPEVRRQVPDLPRHRRVVLHERPHDRCGALGPERDPAAALVVEVVHLLADDVGRLPDPLEHLEVLEDRREDQPEAEPLRPLREHPHELFPAPRFGRQDVVGSRRRAELRLVIRAQRRRLDHRRMVPVTLSVGAPGGFGGFSASGADAGVTGQHAVGGVHAVDPLDRHEDRLEVVRVGELELEAELGHPVARRLRRARQDVDVVLRQHLRDVAQEVRAVERLDLDRDDVGGGLVVVPLDLDEPLGVARRARRRSRSRCGAPTRRDRGSRSP